MLVHARARPTLGLLISHLEGTYQSQFWRGLVRFCRHHDCDLVVYASRLWRGQADSFRDQEAVYHLANSRRIDALCIDTSAFRNREDLEAFLEASTELRRTPMVFASLGGPGRPQVRTDNRGGMRQALAHLTDVHGCQRLAFVAGPPDIDDASERLQAFEEFLGERRLSAAEGWRQEGTFDTPSGRAATLAILESPAGLPEAIVFANDLMALGGLEVLKERGIAVPETVKVTGFDNVNLSLVCSPSLSTVAQPIEAKAWLAGRCLLDAVNGRPVSPPLELETRFVPRASCGCSPGPADPDRPPASLEPLASQALRTIDDLSQLTEYLGSVLSLTDLAAQMVPLVPRLGLGATSLSLFDDQTEPSGTFAHLVCAVDDHGLVVSPDYPRRFPAEQIVPAQFQEKGQAVYLVQLLHKGGTRFGFLTTVYRDADPAVLVALRHQISEALRNIEAVQTIDKGQKALQEALDKVQASERRHREFARSLPLFLMETGPGGTVRYLNDEAQRLLAVTPEDLSAGLLLDAFVEAPLSWSDEASYRELRLVSRQGRRLSLLARTQGDLAGVRRWCGLEYRSILESATQPDPGILEAHGLTPRESQVLALELRGLLAKEIADELGISLSTAKGHLGLLYRKLGVGSRDQLFRRFRQHLSGEYGFDSLVFSLLAEVLRGGRPGS